MTLYLINFSVENSNMLLDFYRIFMFWALVLPTQCHSQSIAVSTNLSDPLSLFLNHTPYFTILLLFCVLAMTLADFYACPIEWH